jgi:shikimate 5-dehydrogenase
MDKFGIIGNPVAGSMSPRLFTAAYGGRWPYELIEGADFDASWARFLREYKGINITAPFKEDAFRAADRVAPAARRIGAVNLAVKTPHGVEAYNTDYEGVRLALAEAGTDAARTALVVGCGGAGRAAAAAAVDAGMQLVLQNRTRNRAEVLAEVFGGSVEDDLRTAVRAADVIIYTIPQPTDALLDLQEADFAPAEGCPGKVVLEANYKNPAFPGALLERLERAGGRYVPGRRWLLYQAVTGYALFTGVEPDKEKIMNAL